MIVPSTLLIPKHKVWSRMTFGFGFLDDQVSFMVFCVILFLFLCAGFEERMVTAKQVQQARIMSLNHSFIGF